MSKYIFECNTYKKFKNILNLQIVIECSDNKKINKQKIFYLLKNTNYKFDILYKNNCVWNLMNINISGYDRNLIDSEMEIKNNKIYIKILPQNHINELKKMWTEYDKPSEIFERYNFILDITLDSKIYNDFNDLGKISIK